MLLQLLEKEPVMHNTMIKLFIYSGLRRGELCGLEWKDIGWANHMISVRRSSQYVPGKGIFTKDTKTKTSDRTIKLPSQAFDLLKEYQMWQLEHRFKAGDRWEDTDRIFTKADGTAIHPDSVTEYFRLFVAKPIFLRYQFTRCGTPTSLFKLPPECLYVPFRTGQATHSHKSPELYIRI